jgi:hypothetical protein
MKHDDHPTDRYAIQDGTDCQGDAIFRVYDKTRRIICAKFWDRNEAVVYVARRTTAHVGGPISELYNPIERY